MSSHLVENSRIPAGRAEGKLELPLAPTIAPWKIAGDPPTKIFAKRGPVSQYKYGTGYDTSEWRPGWQPGLVTSPESGLIVLDRDADGFEELLERCGIPLSPLYVLTGRDGGRQYYYDGRGLDRGDWPGQRTLYAADGITAVGDVKSNGFVPAPGSDHPNGNHYRRGPDSARGFDHMLPWLADWTGWLDADQEAAGHRRPAGYASREGWGRNCALYELKKQLFYGEGLDEDDPELARRIYQANDEFGEPLDEEEVRLTVLQVKGWKRHLPPGAVEISSAKLRQYRAQLEQAFSPAPEAQGKDAGQDVVCARKEEDLPSHKQPADLGGSPDSWSPCVPLSCPADLKAKWAAERDTHVLSRDWDERGGEQSQDTYGWVMQQLIAGIQVQRSQIEDQVWACLAARSPNGAILLSEGEDGQVIAWSDPEPDPLREDDEDRQDRDPWPAYPGCPEGRNPKAGRYIGRELGERAVKAAWAAQGCERATGRTLVRWISTRRAELGFESPEDPLGCRYMSIENARRITRELEERGELVKTRETEHYRKMHRWKTLPAAYVIAERPEPTLNYLMKQAFGKELRPARRQAGGKPPEPGWFRGNHRLTAAEEAAFLNPVP